MICTCGHDEKQHPNGECFAFDLGKNVQCGCEAFELDRQAVPEDQTKPAPATTALADVRMTRVELSTLVPDPDNANEHPDENIAAIHASLLEFGQVDPLIVQKQSRRVIAGNARLLVMQSMGMTHGNIIELDVTDERAIALGLAHNHTGRLARWNAAQVMKLVGDLEAFHPHLAAVVGFEPETLAKLTNIAAKEEREAMAAAGTGDEDKPEREVRFTAGGSKHDPATAKAVADEVRWFAQKINAMNIEPIVKHQIREVLEARMREHRERAK